MVHGTSSVLLGNAYATRRVRHPRLAREPHPAPDRLVHAALRISVPASRQSRRLDRELGGPEKLQAGFRPSNQLLYVRAHCFPQLHLDLLPSTFSQGGCDSFVARPPRSVYVEFHSSSEQLFRKLRPHFSALRERYRASGGRLIVATLLREPRSLLLARYTMWAGQSRDCSRGKGGSAMAQYCSRPKRTAALPLSDWLAASPGTMWDHLQRLTNASWNARGGRCAGMDRESARRLVNDRGLFDGIGTTEQMARFIEWAAAATDRRALTRGARTARCTRRSTARRAATTHSTRRRSATGSPVRNLGS